MAAELEELVSRVQHRPSAVLAVELLAGYSRYDKHEGKWRHSYDLAVIRGEPTLNDSRFFVDKLCRLLADGSGAHESAISLARELAARLGVEAVVPSAPEEGRAYSRWVERQAPPEPMGFEVAWSAKVRNDGGLLEEVTGEEEVSATCGGRACALVSESVKKRLGWPDRPVHIRASIAKFGEGYRCHYGARYPLEMPAPDNVRAWRREGADLTSILARLQSATNTFTPLKAMLVFERCFDMKLEELEALRLGEPEAVDFTHLTELIDATQRGWDRPWRLRSARARGTSAAAVIRDDHAAGASILELVDSVRETWELDSSAKILVESALREDENRFERELEFLTKRRDDQAGS
jgi:hypothetical protein